MDHANKTYPEAIESIANTIGLEIPRDKEASKRYAERKNIQDLLYETKKTYSGQLKNSTCCNILFKREKYLWRDS